MTILLFVLCYLRSKIELFRKNKAITVFATGPIIASQSLYALNPLLKLLLIRLIDADALGLRHTNPGGPKTP